MSRVAAVLRDAAARWRWWHAPLGVALGTWTLVYMGAPLQPGAQLSKLVSPWLYNVLQFGLPLVVALLLADAAVAHGARARVAYPVAALAVVLGGVFVLGPALMPWLGSAPGWDFSNDIWLATGVGLLVGLVVAGYALWRHTTARLAQVRAAEAERLARAQALQSARLATLQARVEPRLLFDALGRVAERIDDDPAEADALLGDTIAMLRALLPSAPGGGAAAWTTLARELELVRLRARVGGEAACEPAQLAFDLEPDAATAPVAPTLVPLWLRTLAPFVAPARLEARLDGTLVRLRLVPGRQAHDPNADINADIDADAKAVLATLALQLSELHGDTAGLTRDDAGIHGLHWPLPPPGAPSHPEPAP